MSIVSELILRTGGFQAGVKSAEQALHGLGRSAVGIKSILLSTFAILTTGAIGAGLQHAFDVGGTLKELSASTGAAVGDLAVLQQAFRAAGLEAGDVGIIIGKMNKTLLASAESGKSDALDRLGLSFAKLEKLTATQKLQTIGAAIAALNDPTVRAGTAMEIFGRSGQRTLDLFTDKGALGAAADKVGKQAAILEKNAMLFDQISDNLRTAGLKLQGFFVGMASTLGPAIAPIIDKISNMDFSEWGKKVGEVFGFIVTLFASGELGKLFGEGLLLGVAVLANELLKVLNGAGAYISEALGGAAFLFVEYLSIITKGDFWKGLGNTLLACAKLFVAAMLDGAAAILRALSNVPGMSKAGVAADSVAKSAQGWKDSAASDASGAVGNVTRLFNDLKESAAAVDKDVAGSWQRGHDKAPQLDLDPIMASIAGTVDRVKAMMGKNDAAANKINAEKIAPHGDDADLIKAQKLKLGPTATQTLTKIGGGGVSVGGGPSKELTESRKHTDLLKTIAKNTSRATMEQKKPDASETVFQ